MVPGRIRWLLAGIALAACRPAPLPDVAQAPPVPHQAADTASSVARVVGFDSTGKLVLRAEADTGCIDLCLPPQRAGGEP